MEHYFAGGGRGFEKGAAEKNVKGCGKGKAYHTFTLSSPRY